jgi:anti-anti-sigma factor
MSLPTLTSVNGLPVARMPTDVDAANAFGVGEELSAAVGHDDHGLILDFGETRYLDSAAIDMLLKLDDRLRRRRQTLHLVVAKRSPLRRLLAITGVDRSLLIQRDVAEAFASIE